VEDDLAMAGIAVIDHPHPARDDEINVVGDGLAIEDLLAGGRASPGAAPLDGLTGGRIEEGEEVDAGEATRQLRLRLRHSLVARPRHDPLCASGATAAEPPRPASLSSK